jgi:hypothetical protein
MHVQLAAASTRSEHNLLLSNNIKIKVVIKEHSFKQTWKFLGTAEQKC